MGKNSRSYGLKRPSTAIFGTFGKKILGGGRKKKHYNHGIKVYMTRDSDVYPENSTRAKTANDIACGDMARVQRSLAKYGSPKPKTNPEKNEEQ